MNMVQEILSIVNTQLIPLAFGIIGATSPGLSMAFLHNETDYRRHSTAVSYVLTGQAVLITPLSSFISFLSHRTSTAPLTSVQILLIGVYLVVYVWAVVSYLRMTPDKFDGRQPLIRHAYRVTPILLSVLAMLPKIVSVLRPSP